MTGKKSFIHRAFKNNESGGTDFDEKVMTQTVLKKYGIYTTIPSQTEKYFGVRPDLIDLKKKIAVEINGSVHEKRKVQLQDEFKVNVYAKNNLSLLVIDLDVLQYLYGSINKEALECYIAPILMNLKHTDSLKVDF